MRSFMSRLGQIVLLSAMLVHITASLPPRERDEDDLEELMRREISNLNTKELFSRNYADALIEARLSQMRGVGLERRQLGDIEFSNRYAEYLRSKAKQSSICAFLRRMQTVKKSGLGGDTERVNVLLRQYMCPAVYPWPSDL